MGRAAKLDRALSIHRDAAASLVRSAMQVPEGEWQTPRAEGKWSPAEILEHLNSTYDILLDELKGGVGMAVRTKRWQRILLRFTVVPRILSGGGFPKNARAPRELRPTGSAEARDAALERFRGSGELFEEEARLATPAKKLTHAYFGSASVADGVLLCARHIAHHRHQLE